MKQIIEAPTIQTARLVGGLYILATAAGVASVALQHPVAEAQSHGARLATGALLEMVMSAAIVAIAVAIHPVLARFHARLAIGYVVARAVEGTMFMIGTAGLLTVLTVSRTAAGGNSAADLVLAGRVVTGVVLGAAAFSASAVILNGVLFRTRLVPRWLSAWGLAAAIAYLAGAVLSMYGADTASPALTILDLPTAIQEMTLAVWLIVRGFARATESRRR
jgi:hypothetical protein